ncbi:MAG: hypothetical protein ACYTFG_20260, partial [Planctomycetota bacterium]
AHLAGEIPLEEAIDSIRRNTRKFVRKQQAWFRRIPRIRWLDVSVESDDGATLERAAEACSLVPPPHIP